MTLGRATEWFLAGAPVGFVIVAPYWMVGVAGERDALFAPFAGGLGALLFGMIIDLITTTTKETNV